MRASSLILFVGLTACAASVRATVGDASPDVSVDAAPVDVAPDVPSSACAWSAGPVRDLVVADDASCELIDAIPGAWVLRGCVMRDGRPSLNLTRFDEATGATNELRYEFDSASFEGLTDAALAADRALGRGVIVVSAGLGRRLIGFDGAGAPSAGGIITDRTGGFSLDAWRSPVVRADGYAFIADQVRALWGTSLAFTDRNGFATRATDLGVSPEAPATVSRFMLDGGAFALGWFVPRTSGPQTLVARAYSDEGVPRGAAVTVGPLATTSRYAIRGDAEGLVAVWEDAVDTLPPLTGVAFRALAPDGSARGRARGALVVRLLRRRARRGDHARRRARVGHFGVGCAAPHGAPRVAIGRGARNAHLRLDGRPAGPRSVAVARHRDAGRRARGVSAHPRGRLGRDAHLRAVSLRAQRVTRRRSRRRARSSGRRSR